MYKVFLKYPESLRPAFPRLKEKLEDPDPGIKTDAISFYCRERRESCLLIFLGVLASALDMGRMCLFSSEAAKSKTMPILLGTGVVCHLNPMNYSATKNMRLRKAHLWACPDCLGIFSSSQDYFCYTDRNISQDIYLALLHVTRTVPVVLHLFTICQGANIYWSDIVGGWLIL